MKTEKLKIWISSATAKDTFILFGGNIGSAFWGFLFTLIIARAVSIEEFGVFSAALNLATILTSLSDLGISTGSVGFVSERTSHGDTKSANEYIKASLVIRLISVTIVSLILIIFSGYISSSLLASKDYMAAIYAALLCLFMFPNGVFPFILQAKREFVQSVILDNAFFIVRLTAMFYIIWIGRSSLQSIVLAYGAGFIASVLLGMVFLKTDFLSTKPHIDKFINLIKFSGWIGVNRIISSISGRLDIQMLAILAGATATGIYSIPSRLASFIIVLASSFSSVLATRLASFKNPDLEKKYIIKSTFALIPIIVVIVVWIIIAKPFILTLFGEKYIDAIPVFQALALAQIPFILTVPAVTAIIYSIRKTVYIGALSFFQLAAIFILNYYLIPHYGAFGPTLTFGVTNSLLAAYVWLVVIRYYSKKTIKIK